MMHFTWKESRKEFLKMCVQNGLEGEAGGACVEKELSPMHAL